jgi:hypothetical protein
MEYGFFFCNLFFSSFFLFLFRMKVKQTIDTSMDPIRKHSISSTDGQNSILAPQLKIDANGALVVDEER